MVTLEKSRRTLGAEQCKGIRRLAAQRLTGEMLEQVVAAVVAAEVAQVRRNEIVHQDWLLRGRDAMPSVGELAQITSERLARKPGGVGQGVKDLKGLAAGSHPGASMSSPHRR